MQAGVNQCKATQTGQYGYVIGQDVAGARGVVMWARPAVGVARGCQSQEGVGGVVGGDNGVGREEVPEDATDQQCVLHAGVGMCGLLGVGLAVMSRFGRH